MADKHKKRNLKISIAALAAAFAILLAGISACGNEPPPIEPTSGAEAPLATGTPFSESPATTDAEAQTPTPELPESPPSAPESPSASPDSLAPPMPAAAQSLQDFTRDLTVHFLDVGQADSILVQLPNGENMLIDGGNSGDANSILSYMRSSGVTAIDYLVATHPHADHIGGLPAIIDAVDILNIYMPRKSSTTQTFERLLDSIESKGLLVEEAKSGVTILAIPDLQIDIIAPVKTTYSNVNDHSAVVKLTYGSTSFLFMGDAESASEGDITADVSADVLKVGHHGSDTSTTEAFLRKVAPSYAVISVGRNSYGHPDGSTLSRLDGAGVAVFRTDTDGTVAFTSDGESIAVDKTPTPYQPNAPPDPTATPTSAPTTAPTSAPPPTSGGSYIGNKNSLKFHKTTCHTLPAERNRVLFAAREDAVAAGYDPCGNCKP